MSLVQVDKIWLHQPNTYIPTPTIFDMSVAETGTAWLKAVLVAPFVAVLFGAIAKMMTITYQATQISGNGELAQAQESVFHNGMQALGLLEVVSSIETWVLFGLFVLAVYAAVQSFLSGGTRR
jgi:hypothetical protein